MEGGSPDRGAPPPDFEAGSEAPRRPPGSIRHSRLSACLPRVPRPDCGLHPVLGGGGVYNLGVSLRRNPKNVDHDEVESCHHPEHARPDSDPGNPFHCCIDPGKKSWCRTVDRPEILKEHGSGRDYRPSAKQSKALGAAPAYTRGAHASSRVAEICVWIRRLQANLEAWPHLTCIRPRSARFVDAATSNHTR